MGTLFICSSTTCYQIAISKLKMRVIYLLLVILFLSCLNLSDGCLHHIFGGKKKKTETSSKETEAEKEKKEEEEDWGNISTSKDGIEHPPDNYNSFWENARIKYDRHSND